MKKTLLILFVALANLVNGQHYSNIVFEGAGIRGIAYSGVVSELDARGIRSEFQHVAGTSAGAITALLFSLGYTGEEMEQIISSTKFQQFNDGKWLVFGGIYRMKNKFGYYRGERFAEFIGQLVANKTGDANATFSDLRQQGYPNLYVTGTCLNKQTLTVFSVESYPEMKVKDAVRISMSIPLYFEAVLIDEYGNVVSDPDDPAAYDVYVDGGLTGNFPIWIFDNDAECEGGNPKTLGVRIDSSEQIKQDQLDQTLIQLPIYSFHTYISALYLYINENLNRPPLTETHWTNTISVSSVGIGPKIKKLSFEEKSRLVTSGKAAATAFLGQTTGVE